MLGVWAAPECVFSVCPPLDLPGVVTLLGGLVLHVSISRSVCVYVHVYVCGTCVCVFARALFPVIASLTAPPCPTSPPSPGFWLGRYLVAPPGLVPAAPRPARHVIVERKVLGASERLYPGPKREDSDSSSGSSSEEEGGEGRPRVRRVRAPSERLYVGALSCVCSRVGVHVRVRV